MGAKSDSNTLEITNRTLKLGSDTYQISNFVSVKKRELPKRNGFLIFLLLVALAVTVVGVASQSGARRQRLPPEAVVVPAAAALVLLLIILGRKSKWALIIETNSGTGEVLTTRKEEFVNQLVALISNVMNDRERQANYIVNIEKATIRDQSVREVVMGDKYSNIRDSVIRSPHTTFVNKSVLSNALNRAGDVYGEELRAALQEISAFLDRNENREAIERFNSFNAEMAKPEGKKSVLRGLWNELTRVLPHAAEIASAVKVVATILA
jgi:hypothetical protein